MRQNQSLNVSWTKWMKTRLVEEVIKDMAYFSLSFELQRDKSHASEFFGVRVCVYVCGGGDVPWQRNGMGFKEGCGNSPDKSGDEMGRRLGIQSTCKKPWALGTLRETVATSVLKHVSCWSPGRIAQSGGAGGASAGLTNRLIWIKAHVSDLLFLRASDIRPLTYCVFQTG